MFDEFKSQLPDIDPAETQEWLAALDQVLEEDGPERARYLLHEVLKRARVQNVGLPKLTQTDYINTIPPDREPDFPGDEAMEKRIRRMVRWNAMAMVTRANKRFPGLGGHISTYASSASLYEVGFNHFFRGPEASGGGDQVFIQGHAAPGIYARAFLEGRLSEEQLDFYRRETQGPGLASYPHPYTMPDFWQFPTVSMGLGPISAIYQARFNRYLHNRGIKDTSENRVWAFLGDGETDEPEALGALSVASREGLDNLTFVVNCNLQRLDGPVRGNGKIIQELEATFRGAGWHVIKVVWGPEWDAILAKDVDGVLVQRMNEVVDGQFQKYSVESGAYIRDHFFGKDPRLLKLVEHMSDEEIVKLRRGGHSYHKLYAAYRAATQHQNAPVAILAHTIKGWTLGEGFEASNVTHQMKKLDLNQLRKFRDTLHLPIPDDRLSEAPYFHPGNDSEEVQYLLERRRALGGFLPGPHKTIVDLKAPAPDLYEEFFEGAKGGVEVSTTMAFVRLLRKMLRDKGVGKHVVPIIPDEARTFGMESLFREVGIYAALGQKYEPVDSKMLLNYHESKSGQILEEGITEAGSMASFAAAATAHRTHGVPMIPFYTFYSMFGLQRTGDQAWAVGDARGRGFIMAATAGRTTLQGEGLQHDDGHSQLVATTFPRMLAYDPTYAYELAVIIREGMRRMVDENEDLTYYLTLYNENYEMPPMPKGVEEGILKGMYLLRPAPKGSFKERVQIFGSGPMMRCALTGQQVLAERYGIAADVWSITSYQQLYRDARTTERYNRLHPSETPKRPYIETALEGHEGPVIAVSDWVSELPSLLGRFIDRPFLPLGTDGYGRSDTRQALRRFFELNGRWVVATAFHGLLQAGRVTPERVREVLEDQAIDPEKPDPFFAA